ncbi:SDR family oxidoreductase [Noviherbaspirillum pedocola]|uniref:SDR family oxidoreductase n=1 Tax=Noviherbaspirillum pedocola TaxID=2801341 RepID=A0A934SUH5_9BURK|nr:SDR family oxidoreductase [Noviherbaspirillum pedocola]MBK4735799.1 SDR family oxidoreductase [Noviherbaspirillum pedocola]
MADIKAIVTGHSRGLGAAIVDELLARDVPVLALSRHATSASDPALSQVMLDLADLEALGAWLAGDALERYLGDAERVLLINNAGMLGPVGSLEIQDAADIGRAVNLNVAAPLMLSAALAAEAQGRERRILHVSSGAARNPYPGWSIYCATKAALDQHARAAAADGVPGLAICSLAPGVIDTDMQAEIRTVNPARFPLRERFEALKRDGQLASPQACAQRLVSYALSGEFGQQPVVDLRDLG